MRRWYLSRLAALLPALALGAFLAGCSGGKTEPTKAEEVDPGAPKDTKKEPLASKGRGTLKGVVTLVGTPPTPFDLTEHKDYKEQKGCHAEPNLKDETWVVDGASKGVANVVVWLKAPEGSYFKMEDKDKDPKGGGWEKDKTLNQPVCRFIPHVQVLFPAYQTGKGEERTGQTFTVTNEASFIHNSDWKGGPRNRGGNPRIEPGGKVELKINPDTQPINIKCSIHQFMKAYAWAFDHPYATVTKPDGTFEIPNAPAGAKVEVWYWHESFDPPTPRKLKEVTLEDGKPTTADFTLEPGK